MTTIARYDDLDIPTWALGYLVNGESKGLSESDVGLIQRWTSQFETGPNAAFLFSSEQEEYFTWSPEFGPGATCVKGTVVIAK